MLGCKQQGIENSSKQNMMKPKTNLVDRATAWVACLSLIRSADQHRLSLFMEVLLSQSKSRSVHNFQLYVLDVNSQVFETHQNRTWWSRKRILSMGDRLSGMSFSSIRCVGQHRSSLFKKAPWQLLAYMYTFLLLLVYIPRHVFVASSYLTNEQAHTNSTDEWLYVIQKCMCIPNMTRLWVALKSRVR